MAVWIPLVSKVDQSGVVRPTAGVVSEALDLDVHIKRLSEYESTEPSCQAVLMPLCHQKAIFLDSKEMW